VLVVDLLLTDLRLPNLIYICRLVIVAQHKSLVLGRSM
jgi:hypothetical protein